MDLATLTVDVEDAKTRLEEYRTALKQERDVEDDAIAAAYRAAARGHAIIDLPASVQAGGYLDNGLPKIAVVRATAMECFVRWDWVSNDTLVYTSTAGVWGRDARVGERTVRVPGLSRPEVVGRREYGGRAIVPSIPPRHRPPRARLHLFHLLWEVEEWTPVPPVDPALIRWIRGDMWAVLATWDLTDIERAVLSQRARS